MIYGLMEF